VDVSRYDLTWGVGMAERAVTGASEDESLASTDEDGGLWRAFTNARGERWIGIAFVVVLGFVLWVIIRPESCHDQVATTDSTIRSVEVCEPLGLGSIPVLAWILIVVVLLAPDLTEVSVGVVSFKQRIAAKQQELEQEQAALGLELTRIETRAASAAVANATAQQALNVTQQTMVVSKEEALDRFQSTDDAPNRSELEQTAAAAVVQVPQARAAQEAELIRLWAELAPFCVPLDEGQGGVAWEGALLRVADLLPPKSSSGTFGPSWVTRAMSNLFARAGGGMWTSFLRAWEKDRDATLDAVVGWRGVWEPELASIRVVRNRLVQVPTAVQDSNLAESLAVARLIRYDLLRRFKHVEATSSSHVGETQNADGD
jgi:hypothetical protein